MKELYSHKVLTSFFLWFDNTLLSRGEAYINISGNLYLTEDASIDQNYMTYSSPYKQWIYDSSITGANVPSGVYKDGNFIGRTSGIKLDFNEGRIWVGSGESGNYTASYSVKAFNTYVIGSDELSMVFDGTTQINSRFPSMIAESGVSPYNYVLPACFITETKSENKPFTIGGGQETKTIFRTFVITDNLFEFDGCLSLFRDMGGTNIAFLDLASDPFNEYGDLKSGVYNYSGLSADSSRLLYIDKVNYLRVTKPAELKLNPNLRYGILDFHIIDYRVPKNDV